MGNNLPEVALGEGVNVSAVALGIRHTCVLLNDGLVKCWGESIDNSGDMFDCSISNISILQTNTPFFRYTEMPR